VLGYGCVIGMRRGNRQISVGIGWQRLEREVVGRCNLEEVLRIYMHLVDEVDMSLYWPHSRPSQGIGMASPAVHHGLAA
jgi:hypothetical protein